MSKGHFTNLSLADIEHPRVIYTVSAAKNIHIILGITLTNLDIVSFLAQIILILDRTKPVENLAQRCNIEMTSFVRIRNSVVSNDVTITSSLRI